ncbi:MAG: internalization-related competence protein ComEC/Rec2 [Eubacterium sp.]|nr:internalization-related competence protein ComEC/Rec2 [Eubacterium sp.]
MKLKRPLCLFCAAFIAGIMAIDSFGISLFLYFLAAALILILIVFNKIPKFRILVLITILFFTAGGFSFYYCDRAYTQNLCELYGKPITLQGYVDSEPEKDGDKIKFVFRTDRYFTDADKLNNLKQGKLTPNKGKINAGLMVYINTQRISSSKYNSIGYRTRLSFATAIEEPKPATNPGGFDYRRYLASIGISGTAYMSYSSEIDILGVQRGGWINKLGYKIKNTVLHIVEFCLDKNQAGLLAGMIIGYKDGLDENAFQAFSRAGLTHIMVASGMNVAFIILPLTFIFNKLRIGKRSANIMTILVLILFVFVTGFSASVVRAVIMGIIILTGQIIMRETDIYTSISAAALILLIINPFTLFDIGFQLSFGATLSLVMFYPKIKGTVTKKYVPEIISDTLAATLAAQIGVIPVTLYYFNSLSIISVLSNLLVVPLVQIITIIGFIMVFAGLLNIHMAVLIGYINNSFLSFILFVTETSAKIPFAAVKLPTPSIGLILIYYTVILYLFKGRQILNNFKTFKYVKYASVVILFLFILISNLFPKPLEITFLDVGQGDGAFIRTPLGTKVIIDGGGREAGSNSTFDIGEAVMVPYILDQGTKSVDIVVASHGHADHTEGLEAILKELQVGTVILPDTDGNGFEKIEAICSSRNIRIIECKKGDLIRIDRETQFKVLNPLKFSIDSLSQQSLNNSSLVLKLLYKNISVLFTGDSELPVEERLLGEDVNIRADMLKVGHHGSVTSSSEAFIDMVKPRYAVISVGEHNKFGHPSQFVVDRFQERGIKLYRTDQCGAVIVKSYGNDFRISTMLR